MKHLPLKNIRRENLVKTVIVVIFAILLIIFVTNRVMAEQKQHSERVDTSEGVGISKTFEINQKNSRITSESTTVTASDGDWNLQSFSKGFTNQAQLDAEQKAVAAVQNHDSAKSTYAASSQAKPSNVNTSSWRAVAPPVSGNKYTPGYCTWYAYNRRAFIGRPIKNQWGNGGEWHNHAGADGYKVNHTPEVGAVLEMSGHVAVVEAVGKNNTVFISEMNWKWTLYRYNTRWLSNATRFWYIH
ncbi:MAG: CHAP domain-containing protein [Candidatus Ancillula sp.]|jgi:surface antigen|nr:CHAP domain-containing protein [Candidatus Ancillula sp.]